MSKVVYAALLLTVALVSCGRSGGEPDGGENPAPPGEGQQTAGQEAPEETPPPQEPPPEREPVRQPVITTQADAGIAPTQVAEGSGEVAPDVVRDGYLESPRFNVRFLLPSDWQVVSAPGEDSLGILGPAGIQMVVASTFSVQLVDANFNQLNDRISFDNVNLVPDRAQARPINGLPAYRVEGDALLRGENVPIYFISQVINLPDSFVMTTVFIPGENYFEYSDAMHGVLDSMEALNLRPQ